MIKYYKRSWYIYSDLDASQTDHTIRLLEKSSSYNELPTIMDLLLTHSDLESSTEGILVPVPMMAGVS